MRPGAAAVLVGQRQAHVFRPWQRFPGLGLLSGLRKPLRQLVVALDDTRVPLHGPVQRVRFALGQPELLEAAAEGFMDVAVLFHQRRRLRQQRQGLFRRSLGCLRVELGGLQAVEDSLTDQFHPPRPEQEVVQDLRVDRRLLLASFQMLDGRSHDLKQPIGGSPGGRNAHLWGEIVLPEAFVVHPLHAGQPVRLGQQLDGLSEMISRFSEQHGTDAAVELLRIGGGRGPGALGTPGVAVPFGRVEGFAVVFPSRVEHAQGTVLGAVSDEMVDVCRGHAEVGQDAAPIAHPRTDEELIARAGKRNDLIFEARPVAVAPGQHERVFGDLLEIIRMAENNIAPHHHPFLVLLLEQIVNPSHVPHVDTADADLLRQLLRRPSAQAIRLVATDVEERKRQQGTDFGVKVVEQLIAFLLDRAQQRRRFAKGSVLLVLQNPREVPERLLIAQDVDVEPFRVSHQLAEGLGRERAVFRADQRVLLEGVLIFHVVGEEVHLQVRAQSHLGLEHLRLGARAAGHVVLETAPAHRGPVAHLQARQSAVAAIRPDQLAQGLHRVEQPGLSRRSTDDCIRLDLQRVVLRRGAVAELERRPLSFTAS